MKLDHEQFKKSLAITRHDWADDPAYSFGFMQGIYAFLESLGFENHEPSRIILEHLMPGYYIERIKPGRVYFASRFNNVFDSVAGEYKCKAHPPAKSPFTTQSERKIQQFYSDSTHSQKFRDNYETVWYPEHIKIIRSRDENKSLAQRLRGCIRENDISVSYSKVIYP